jgi:hypothetical protein
MGKDVFNSLTYSRVTSVGSQLCQKDHLPEGRSVLWGVAWTGFDPVAIRVLGVQDSGDGSSAHNVCPCGCQFGVVIRLVKQIAQGKVANTGIGLVWFQ